MEEYDFAAAEGAGGIGIDALHGCAPDEILADVPFVEWGAEPKAAAVEVEQDGVSSGVGRDALLLAITTQVWEGRPGLREAGLRFCAMASRAGLPVPLKGEDLRELKRVAVRANGSLWLPRCEAAAVVFQLLQGRERMPRRIGRRLSLMAYALNRGYVIRQVFPSMEAIGDVWGLSAENKRSAVCEALAQLKQEILRCGWLRQHKRRESFHLWYEKSEQAKAVYEQVQLGNQNRLGGDEAEAESPQTLVLGIPVKPEFRGLSAKELRQRLDALWAEHEGR